MFRSQEFRELCGRCREPAEHACPRCEQPLCAGHVFPPDGCCEPCAIEIYLTVSRAGKKHLTAGSVLGGAATALFYICWQIHYLPISLLAVVMAGFCASLVVIVWGGAVAPRLASGQLQRQFRRRLEPRDRQLGAPRDRQLGAPLDSQPGHQLDHQLGASFTHQLGTGRIGVPAQLPEPGNGTS